MGYSSSKGRKRSSTSSRSDPTTNTKSPPYDADFEHKLIDSGVYPEGYEYSDEEASVEPANTADIQGVLQVSRASLSPSRFSEGTF